MTEMRRHLKKSLRKLILANCEVGMLKYFFDASHVSEVDKIREIISEKKARLERLDFDEPYRELNEIEPLLKSVKSFAFENNIEELANAQYVTRLYVKLFCQLSSYFQTIRSEKYKESWFILQDCLDSAYWIGQHTIIEHRYEVPQIVDLLHNYESLYPYKVFASTEMVISKSECSICGKSMNSLDCTHLKGHLYWGEPALEKIIDVKEFQAVALVSHPLDKRCIMEFSDDDRTEEEKFQMLHEFLKQEVYPYQMFSVENQVSYRQRTDIQIVGRNNSCPCGSGKKFKNCCGHDLFYEHHHYVIHPLKRLDFLTN